MRSEISALRGTEAFDVLADVPFAPAMLAALPGPVMYLDARGEIIGVNAEGEKLAGLLSPSLITTLRAQAAGVLATGETLTQTFSVRDGDAARSIEASMIRSNHGLTVIIGRDATLDMNMRAALVDSRRRYKDLVEISSDFAWETAADGAFSFVSPRGALGYPAEALVGMMARDLLLDPESAPRVIVFEADRPTEQAELWLKNAAAEPVCVLSSAVPLFDRDGRRKGARGVCRDITVERLRENDLARHKAREQVVEFVVDAIRNEAKPANMLTTAVTSLGRAMTETACAVYQTGDTGKLSRAARYGVLPDGRRLSAALKRCGTGSEIVADQIAGYKILIVATHYRGHANGALLLCRESGARDWNDEERLMLNAVAGQLGIALQQVGDQQELLRLSRTDPLTGLLNRRAFLEELTPAIERARRGKKTSAVLFIDLNNFKAVNDLHGHAEGDSILRQLAKILRSSIRSYDCVARLGGDEFAVWFEIIGKESAGRHANAIIRDSLIFTRSSAATEKPLGLSIGIAVLDPNSTESPEHLLKRADTAMYRAKNSKKQDIAFAPKQSPRRKP